MFKTVVIFKNIEDMDALQNVLNEVMPPVHRVPGVICTDITRLVQSSPEVPEDLNGIKLILETYFESEEIMNNYLISPEAQELMRIANEFSLCEFYFYLGSGKRIFAENRFEPSRSTDYSTKGFKVQTAFNVD